MDLQKKSFGCTSHAMKLLWISETSCNVYLQEFMHRVFNQVTILKRWQMQRFFQFKGYSFPVELHIDMSLGSQSNCWP